MRCSRVMITAMATLCVAVVHSLPVQQPESLVPAGQDLDRLMVVEADNEAALRSKRTIGLLRQLFPGLSQDVNPEAENQIVAESQNNEVRVQFADDQAGAAANEAVAPELAPLDDVEVADENRNKRFLNFDTGNGGSGGGSGNFLFDIIRLVAGSGSTEQGDAAANAPVDPSRAAAGAQEAVPGPITRLFVIANRGISNLVQDLILRLAATSERIVNFKARLITSII